jgi:hypothetical protein
MPPSSLTTSRPRSVATASYQASIDPAKVNAAAAAVIESHPHWRKGHPDFGGGDRGIDVTASSNNVTWAKAFKQAGR